MYCKKCGKEIPDSTKFCMYCGEPTAQENIAKPAGKEGPQKNLKLFITACVGVIAVMVIGTCVFLVLNSKAGKQAPIEETTAAIETTAMEETTVAAETTAAETTTEPEMTTVAETTAEPETKYQTYFVANCDTSITLRTEPSTKAAEIRQIPYGASVSYVETAENGFYKVIYLGNTGYALASYLSETQPPAKQAAPVSGNTKHYTTYYVVNCDENISLRTAPKTSANRITTIPLGAAVSFIEGADNGFYKISYLGNTGYALASYLSANINDVETGPWYGYYVANCDEWISLRVAPDTSSERIVYIPLGASVVVRSKNESNGFWKISYNGYVGYALSQYLGY